MKILVPIKRVIDYRVSVRVKGDQTGVVTDNVKMSINPFDEIALEEALRLKEQQVIDEIIAVTIGTTQDQEGLLTALAMGAARGIHVIVDHALEPLLVAKLLAVICQREQPTIVIMGKQAIDDDCNQTGQMLAGLLSWPQATFASKLVFNPDHLEVTREIDGGLETVQVQLPAVVTTDLRLNQPRYVTLPNIMKARQKPINTITATQLGVDLGAHIQYLKVSSPKPRQAGIIVDSVANLVNKLKNEAKAL